jgi:hypothetical protein
MLGVLLAGSLMALAILFYDRGRALILLPYKKAQNKNEKFVFEIKLFFIIPCIGESL